MPPVGHLGRQSLSPIGCPVKGGSDDGSGLYVNDNNKMMQSVSVECYVKRSRSRRFTCIRSGNIHINPVTRGCD